MQYPTKKNKPVIELHSEFREPDFPGFLHFVQPLSKLDNMPKAWIAALKSSRGIYLLTCPKTKEQYVGSATGEEGFWGRWQNYVQTGHGGNVALKSRSPSDYLSLDSGGRGNVGKQRQTLWLWKPYGNGNSKAEKWA